MTLTLPSFMKRWKAGMIKPVAVKAPIMIIITGAVCHGMIETSRWGGAINGGVCGVMSISCFWLR